MTDAALHNRLVGILLHPDYSWTSPESFFAELRSQSPGLSQEALAAAGIEAGELLLERLRALLWAFRPPGQTHPAFDGTGDPATHLAAVFLAFDQNAKSGQIGRRFGLNDKQVQAAFGRASAMLEAPR
jgi:hypothetical protein